VISLKRFDVFQANQIISTNSGLGIGWLFKPICGEHLENAILFFIADEFDPGQDNFSVRAMQSDDLIAALLEFMKNTLAHLLGLSRWLD